MQITSGKRKKVKVFNVVLHTFMVLLALCYILPLVLVVSASFTNEEYLAGGGAFSLIPKGFTFDAYKATFANGERMLRAYAVTASQAFLTAFLAVVVSGMVGYALSRSNFRFKGPVSFIIFFTMLFSAGTIPNYLIFSKWYHITNTFWVYILPMCMGGAYYTLIQRTFFKGIPESLFESAHIDGAKELYIYFKIVVPLSKPVIATLGFMCLVGKWNDYSTSLVYIRDENLYTLQFLLQRILSAAKFLAELEAEAGVSLGDQLIGAMPSESLKFAMCVVAAGPMLFVFPFFQKYFSQGLTVGSVKG